jgi:hypothetical protein
MAVCSGMGTTQTRVHPFFLRWHDPALLVEHATRHENTQQQVCYRLFTGIW